jgi:integrase
MTLTNYCKLIYDLPVKNIDTDLVLRVLTPLWTKRTQTAKRLRGRIERVLSWAKGRELRTGENPARWAGHLDEMLAAPSKVAKVRHHPALPYLELPAFMAELRSRDSISARALECAILSAARTSEVIGVTWDEIDIAGKVWTVPPERMKAGKEHRVPLTARMLEILAGLPRRKGNVVFASAGNKPLSNMAMLDLLRGMRPGTTVHGFRSTFRTWASEQSRFNPELSKAALAHTISDKVDAAYQRGDLFEKRRRLMDAWAAYCAKPAPVGATVTPLRKAHADA